MRATLSRREIADRLFNDKNANWTYNGAYALAGWLEDYEDLTDEELEFDRVAIRCDFTQYDDLQSWAMEYAGTDSLIEACEQLDIDEDIAMSTDSSEIDEAIREYIQDNGSLIEFDGGIIASSF